MPAVFPDTQGVRYDRSEVMADTDGPLRDAGAGEGDSRVGGDFFGSVPPGGDAHALADVIHDRDDEMSRRFLANCREIPGEEGRVLLAGTVVPDRPRPTPLVSLTDLYGPAVHGGRQRTTDQFTDLLADARSKPARIATGGDRTLVEAMRE
ncbi:methyltransferase [Streptomyces caelestis]|uniref:methyltransferase n=1 Tax=Streptomyces caelestis TaxID=36816 RepID=UPI003829E0F9